eukprot:maker-scaffold_47-snap-gene-1.4-mRNA-1 protein AED:0.00 eAED:0.00 QI:422/1/1/1/1/0.75/4/110/500
MGGVKLEQGFANRPGRRCYKSSLSAIFPNCLGNVKESRSRPLPEYLKEILDEDSSLARTESENFFQLQFGQTNYKTQVKIVELLKENNWLDEKTRIIDLEIGFFNGHTRVFGVLDLSAYFYSEGTVQTKDTVSFFRVDPYNLNFPQNKIQLCFEIFWMVLLIAQCWYNIRLYLQGKLNLRIIKVHRVLRILHMFVHFVLIAHFIYYIQDETRLGLSNLNASSTSSREDLGALSYHINFQNFATWADTREKILFVEMFFYTVRSINFFRVTKRGDILVNSLLHALPEIVSFLPIYFAVDLGFALTGMILFGSSYSNWSSLQNAMFTVFEMNLGAYDINTLFLEQQLYENNPQLGNQGVQESNWVVIVFFYTVLIVNSLILVNFFLAIVVGSFDSITEEKEKVRKEKKQHLPEIKNWRIVCFAACLGRTREFFKMTIAFLDVEIEKVKESEENSDTLVKDNSLAVKSTYTEDSFMIWLKELHAGDSYPEWFFHFLCRFIWKE